MKQSFLLMILMGVLSSQHCVAAEAVGMSILLDGTDVAGFTITYTGQTEAELWLMLKQTPLTWERGFKIPVDSDADDRATLKGNMEIRAMRRGRPGTTVTVDSLRLRSTGSGRWLVDPSDVEKTLKAAGLKMPGPKQKIEPASRFLLDAWAKGSIVAVAFLIACAVWMKQRKRPSEEYAE